MGITWLGIIHDWSKFLPDEFFPYAEHFYGSKKVPKIASGYIKSEDKKEDPAFDRAWLYHQRRNKHHWQWWVLVQDQDPTVAIEMPERYWKEMVCDWKGAGAAQGTPDTAAWYEKNKARMVLHPLTRDEVEDVLF
jgi:hypothetical protein